MRRSARFYRGSQSAINLDTGWKPFQNEPARAKRKKKQPGKKKPKKTSREDLYAMLVDSSIPIDARQKKAAKIAFRYIVKHDSKFLRGAVSEKNKGRCCRCGKKLDDNCYQWFLGGNNECACFLHIEKQKNGVLDPFIPAMCGTVCKKDYPLIYAVCLQKLKPFHRECYEDKPRKKKSKKKTKVKVYKPQS